MRNLEDLRKMETKRAFVLRIRKRISGTYNEAWKIGHPQDIEGKR